MTRDEFIALFEKQFNGTINSKEQVRLQQWIDKQQAEGLQHWDEQLLGDQKLTEQEIYSAIEKHKPKAPIKHMPSYWLRIAAAIIFLGSVTLLFFRSTGIISQHPDIAYHEVTTSYGQIKRLVLSDSSIIWLNAGSRLRYPGSFDGSDKRQIYLEGEAFFDVKHRSDQPFIVHSGQLNTQVLGTSFNIKAYSNSKAFKVTVATGKVAIYTQKLKALYLTPGHAGTYNNSKNIMQDQLASAQDVMAWRDGKLIYKNELLSEALEDIGHRNGVMVKLSADMIKCRIYGTFNNANTETLLKMVAFSSGAKLIRQSKGFIISGARCN